MQIGNWLGQYNQATAAGAETVTGTKGVERLVSSLNSLTKGNIFEGTISEMKNGKVVLALSNGTYVNARVEGQVKLTVGQSMFFQVKSNDGTQIAIRPFVVDGNGVNYTLMKALAAAGLSTESNYLSMANRMMEEQMPIDRASIQNMAHIVNSNPGIDVQTLVQMTKLGIPITVENASQFENYAGDRQAITTELDNLIENLPEAMKGEDLSDAEVRQMDARVLNTITEGLVEQNNAVQDNGTVQPNVMFRQDGVVIQLTGNGETNELGMTNQMQNAEGVAQQNPLMDAAQQTQALEMSAISEAEAEAAGQQETTENALDAGATAAEPAATEVAAQQVAENGADSNTNATAAASESTADNETSAATNVAGQEQTVEAQSQTQTAPSEAAPNTLAAVFDQSQLANLNEMLGNLVGQQSTNYGGQTTTAQLLSDLSQFLQSGYAMDRGGLQLLLSSDEFQTLVRDVLEQQWTVRPEDLRGSDQINRLYAKLDGQLERMSDILKETGQQSTSFTETAADVRGNVEFMNQINQTYTFVQIPLKMSGQTASGDLYVYTNKKALAEGDKAITAFLHLDMDNLGSTDVSVKLYNKDVSTDFYLENDASYELVRMHIPELEARLREKGYNCTVSVTNEEKHVDFVEDFLKKDLPSAGQVHRYSFDMRA